MRDARVGAEDVGRESRYLPYKYTVNFDQGRQHGHGLAASICLCREQNGFFITALSHTMILYLRCQESPFTDLIL